MAQKKKTVKLIDYVEINVYQSISGKVLDMSELSFCTFEEFLYKLLQLHKRFPNDDFDIFFRPFNFGGNYVKSTEE